MGLGSRLRFWRHPRRPSPFQRGWGQAVGAWLMGGVAALMLRAQAQQQPLGGRFVLGLAKNAEDSDCLALNPKALNP